MEQYFDDLLLSEMIVNIIHHHVVVPLQKIEDHPLIARVIEVEIMNMNDREVIENHPEIEMKNTNATLESNFLFLVPFSPKHQFLFQTTSSRRKWTSSSR